MDVLVKDASRIDCTCLICFKHYIIFWMTGGWTRWTERLLFDHWFDNCSTCDHTPQLRKGIGQRQACFNISMIHETNSNDKHQSVSCIIICECRAFKKVESLTILGGIFGDSQVESRFPGVVGAPKNALLAIVFGVH